MNIIPGPWELIILLPLLSLILMIWLQSRKQTQPPKERLTPDGQWASNVSAWRRLINFVIDIGLINLILFIVISSQQGRFSENDLMGQGYLIAFLYYFLFEATLQKTPGKYVTRTKVVSSKIMHYWESPKPGPGTIAWRTVIRFVPFEIISGWWHDRWSETRLVKD